jgi:hypothetical protein
LRRAGLSGYARRSAGGVAERVKAIAVIAAESHGIAGIGKTQNLTGLMAPITLIRMKDLEKGRPELCDFVRAI